MDDLISRQAAIDAVRDRMGKGETHIGDTFIECFEMILNALPSAQPYTDEEIQKMQDLEQAQFDKMYELGKQAAEPQWIPCSERLPEEDYWTGGGKQFSADVLMTVFNKIDDETIIDLGHTVDGEWYSETTDCYIPHRWKVLAWMPLPEPWRGELDEEKNL